MKVIPLSACPSCGAAHTTPYTIGGDTRLNRCTGCGLVYATEFVDPEEIYVDGYLRGASEDGFGLDIFHPYFQAFLGYAADARMRRIERYIRPPGRLLDVGCGSGEVLQAAMRHAWTATGVEPVEESAKIALDRGLDVRQATLEDSELDERSFDVVSAFHVLEHMNDATGFLRGLARYARPGGRVVIEVPNLRSAHRAGFGADWPGLRPLEHICHFTPATLRHTFQRAGMRTVSVTTIGFLWRGETLGEMLRDLGLRRWRGRLGRLGQPGHVIGRTAVVPRPSAWAAMRLTQAVCGLVGVGPAVFAVGRVD